jgi:GT2 family glycosyltransferase
VEFSIIVAVRNEEKTIQECIESLYNQTYTQRYEVIVVEGYSEDNTYTILQHLQKQYDFQLYQNATKNAAAGRNTGIKHAKGKKLAFIDGDAVASKNWLDQIKKIFEKHPKAIGVGGPDLLPKNSELKSKMIGYFMTSPLARGGKFNPSTQHSYMKEEKHVDHIPTCNLCLKREIFNKVGLFDEQFVKGQDLELNYRIRKQGYKLVYSPTIKVTHYRKEHVSTFSRQIYKWSKAKVAIIKKHGMDGITSHIYLWPVYALLMALLLSSIFLLLNAIYIFFLFLLSSLILYIVLALNEAVDLMKKYHIKLLFFYALLLFPIVHGAYAYGIYVALVKKNIW